MQEVFLSEYFFAALFAENWKSGAVEIWNWDGCWISVLSATRLVQFGAAVPNCRRVTETCLFFQVGEAPRLLEMF